MDWDHLAATIEEIHADQPERAAELLEANLMLVGNAPEAERYTSLVNRVLGRDREDWDRAVLLDRRALDRVSDRHRAHGALGNLATAQLMGGHVAQGLATELSGLLAAGDHALAALIIIRLHVAAELLQRGQRTDAVDLFHPTASAARALTLEEGCNRHIAQLAHDFTTALLAISDRTYAEEQALELGAVTAHDFWFKSGSPNDRARAEYLLALAYNSLRRHAEAYQAAMHGLGNLETDATDGFARTLLLVELSYAARHLGRDQEAADAARRARELAGKLSAAHLKSILADSSSKLA